MAELNEILTAAGGLGRLIGSHPNVATYRELVRQLELDVSAQNLLGQFQQLMEALSMKEAGGQPIEIAEKRQAEQLQQSMAMHPLLKKLAAAQAEYMQVMEKVQQAINAGLSGQGAPAAPAAAPSKIILG